jgi:hypothetical protein
VDILNSFTRHALIDQYVTANNIVLSPGDVIKIFDADDHYYEVHIDESGNYDGMGEGLIVDTGGSGGGGSGWAWSGGGGNDPCANGRCIVIISTE